MLALSVMNTTFIENVTETTTFSETPTVSETPTFNEKVTATPHMILSTTSPDCSGLCEACVPGSYSDNGESEL